MKNKLASPPTRGFWIISVFALLWNLLGVLMYVLHVTMTPEALAALPEAERELYTNTPAWVNGVFAIAVFAGTLGAIALLMRRIWAIHAFVLSLVAVVIQFGHSIFISDSMAVLGPAALILPILLLAIAAYLVFYSRAAARNGVLR